MFGEVWRKEELRKVLNIYYIVIFGGLGAVVLPWKRRIPVFMGVVYRGGTATKKIQSKKHNSDNDGYYKKGECEK